MLYQVWFETGITQSMAWTLLAPYISSCPAENPPIVFQNFPALNITVSMTSRTREDLFSNKPQNNPDATKLVDDSHADITNNRSAPLSYPNRTVTLQWDAPGKKVGYNDSYTTNTTAGAPLVGSVLPQPKSPF